LSEVCFCHHSTLCICVELNSCCGTEWLVSCWELLPKCLLMPLHNLTHFKQCDRQLNVLCVVKFRDIWFFSTAEYGNKKLVKKSGDFTQIWCTDYVIHPILNALWCWYLHIAGINLFFRKPINSIDIQKLFSHSLLNIRKKNR
jgi:hypothetical protein